MDNFYIDCEGYPFLLSKRKVEKIREGIKAFNVKVEKIRERIKKINIKVDKIREQNRLVVFIIGKHR